MRRSILPTLLALSGVLSLVSCGLDTPTHSDTPLSTAGSARLLPLSGTLFRMGSSDPQAPSEESIGWTRFRHDLWMDTCELTQAEFRSLLGRNPSNLRGDSLPVTNVSWFDAVLCANARSRKDGLDTVYEYSLATKDSDGNTLDLQGIAIHLDRNGWRLPTEAEWEAAARAGASSPYAWGSLADSAQAASFAWFSQNSGGSVHPVATKRSNAWGLHDMAGNAMEWVNDWKGPFPKDTLDDYAGLDAPADVPEIPLKGGAYNYGLSNLRPSARTATYAAYRSSRADYVGFRLARGAFQPTYGTTSGLDVSAPPVSIDLTALPGTLGAVAARIVFLNRTNGKGILSWIDFAEANPVVRTLPDKDPVFHPVISPDGQWVVWSTVLEGSPNAGHIKARRLAKSGSTVLDLGQGGIPRFWVNGSDTFLVQASPMDNTQQAWSSASTTARRWSSSGTLDPSTDVWVQNGAFHDGRSGDFLYTGYRRLRQYDTRTGTARILFTAPQNGKAAGDTSQVCNVSAAPDSSGRALFLDFGYDGISSVVGSAYGIHQVAFVTDSQGNVQKKIPVPGGWEQWDHLEWSNHPRWAVSSALDANGAAKAVFLLDLQTGATSKILHGNDLWQPMMWVGTPDQIFQGISIDSAARYSEGWSGNDNFSAKLRLFEMTSQDIEILFLGSSHIRHGIVPGEFRARTLNFGYGFGFPWEAEPLLRSHIIPHSRKLKVVGLALSPEWMFWPGASLWAKGFSTSAGYTYDSHHGFWGTTYPAGLVAAAKLLRSSTPSDLLYDTTGFIEYPGTGWLQDTSWDATFPASFYDSTSTDYQANLVSLEKLMELADSSGLKVLMVNFPRSPNYASCSHAGYYDPPWPLYHKVLRDVREIISRHPNSFLYDAHNDGAHDYTGKDAYNDWNHLSTQGGRKLSHRIDSLISSLGWIR